MTASKAADGKGRAAAAAPAYDGPPSRWAASVSWAHVGSTPTTRPAPAFVARRAT